MNTKKMHLNNKIILLGFITALGVAAYFQPLKADDGNNELDAQIAQLEGYAKQSGEQVMRHLHTLQDVLAEIDTLNSVLPAGSADEFAGFKSRMATSLQGELKKQTAQLNANRFLGPNFSVRTLTKDTYVGVETGEINAVYQSELNEMVCDRLKGDAALCQAHQIAVNEFEARLDAIVSPAVQ